MIAEHRRGSRGAEYVEMLDAFGPAVCRSKTWKGVRMGAAISEVLTVQLEAFLIVVLENEARHEARQYEIKKSASKGDQVPVNDIKRPYTNGGEVTCNGHWNKAAMVRYRKLCSTITEDRESAAGKKLEKEFQEKILDQKKGARRRAGNGGDANLSGGQANMPPEDVVYIGWEDTVGFPATAAPNDDPVDEQSARKRRRTSGEDSTEDDISSSFSTPRSSINGPPQEVYDSLHHEGV